MSEGAELRFFYGPMNSGKSTLLIQQAYAHRSKGQEIIVAKPKTDTKAGDDIESRPMKSPLRPDLIIPTDADLRSYVMGHIAMKNIVPRRIITDEAQFFTPSQVEGLWEITKRDNIPVDAYGLRTDFQGNLFPGTLRLFELADELEMLRTQICSCGSNKPNFNIRLFNNVPVFEGEQVAIEGLEADYETVCGDCFLQERDKYELRKAEATRIEQI